MSVLGELSHSRQPTIRCCCWGKWVWPDFFSFSFLGMWGNNVVDDDASFFSNNSSFVYVLQGWLMHHRHVTGDPNIPSQERSWGAALTSDDYLNDKYEWCIDHSVVWWFCTALPSCRVFLLFCLCSVCSRHAESTTGVYMYVYKYCTCFGCWLFWNLTCAWLVLFVCFFMTMIIPFYFP